MVAGILRHVLALLPDQRHALRRCHDRWCRWTSCAYRSRPSAGWLVLRRADRRLYRDPARPLILAANLLNLRRAQSTPQGSQTTAARRHRLERGPDRNARGDGAAGASRAGRGSPRPTRGSTTRCCSAPSASSCSARSAASTAAYMNFSLGFFIGGQVLAGILGSDGHATATAPRASTARTTCRRWPRRSRACRRWACSSRPWSGSACRSRRPGS